VFKVFADLNQPVKGFAVNQRLQIGAHQHIGRRLAGLRITHHADRMIGARHHAVTDIGFKLQPVAAFVEIDGNEGRVIYGNSHLLDRGDQHIIIPIAPQNR